MTTRTALLATAALLCAGPAIAGPLVGVPDGDYCAPGQARDDHGTITVATGDTPPWVGLETLQCNHPRVVGGRLGAECWANGHRGALADRSWRVVDGAILRGGKRYTRCGGSRTASPAPTAHFAPVTSPAAERSWLSLGARTPGATITHSSGLGTAQARAVGRVSRDGARENCGAYSLGNTDLPSCTEDWLRQFPNDVHASADCQAGVLRPTSGGSYRYAGEQTTDEAMGPYRSKWRGGDGQVVGLDDASGGLALSQQWAMLCGTGARPGKPAAWASSPTPPMVQPASLAAPAGRGQRHHPLPPAGLTPGDWVRWIYQPYLANIWAIEETDANARGLFTPRLAGLYLQVSAKCRRHPEPDCGDRFPFVNSQEDILMRNLKVAVEPTGEDRMKATVTFRDANQRRGPETFRFDLVRTGESWRIDDASEGNGRLFSAELAEALAHQPTH